MITLQVGNREGSVDSSDDTSNNKNALPISEQRIFYY
jgi:hypothetical protein